MMKMIVVDRDVVPSILVTMVRANVKLTMIVKDQDITFVSRTASTRITFQ